ncbi:hypothetical protein ALP25_05510 [Pseudomonas syringae pv. syringae]|nr:hypothetical protein ALP25_05510 [Pseudomonas syringae pv. syringae]
MDQRRRIDAIGMYLTQHQAQELGGAGQQRVLIGRPGNEVVGQIRTTLPHGGNVIDGQVQLLEAEAARLADRTGQKLVAGDRQRMAFRPGGTLGATLDTKEAVGVQTQYASAHDIDGVQRVADDHLLRGKAGVQPVQGGLAVLEIMQVNPTAGLAINALYHVSGAPVGFLDPRLEENYPLQLADDVMLVAQLIHHIGHQVDSIAARRHFRQQLPVFLTDLDHVEQTGVILVRHLGQAEVSALAGVRRDDVVDDHRVVRCGNARQAQQLRLGTQVRVDAETDAVEVAIDTWRALAALQAAGKLQRPVVNALDADFRQCMPEGLITQRFEHRAAFAGDDGGRVGGKPDRGDSGGVSGTCKGERTLPEPALPRIGLGALSCGVQHRLLDQPFHVLLVRYRHSVQSSSRIGDLRRPACGAS